MLSSNCIKFFFLLLSFPWQTKDALFTVLRDLRAVDHFNFISFSNKIKVWRPSSLVPVTPLNIRDAKKFIFTLGPTGGENVTCPGPTISHMQVCGRAQTIPKWWIFW